MFLLQEWEACFVRKLKVSRCIYISILVSQILWGLRVFISLGKKKNNKTTSSTWWGSGSSLFGASHVLFHMLYLCYFTWHWVYFCGIMWHLHVGITDLLLSLSQTNANLELTRRTSQWVYCSCALSCRKVRVKMLFYEFTLALCELQSLKISSAFLQQ